MRTIMSYLIEKWNYASIEEFEVYFSNNRVELVEKEKQLIIDTYFLALCGEKVYSDEQGEIWQKQAEKHYEETFKQRI